MESYAFAQASLEQLSSLSPSPTYLELQKCIMVPSLFLKEGLANFTSANFQPWPYLHLPRT
jgi:hypothetical protein